MQDAVRRFETEMTTVLVEQWRGCSWQVAELGACSRCVLRSSACGAPTAADGAACATRADDDAPQPAEGVPASRAAAARDDDHAPEPERC